ncbi:MAG TPA: alpha-glucan family phosphorylase [Nannocystaceae bacterium]|nr:alpha-glucan family phosphorylase [Nannocystaceae bacterium]
MYPLKSTPSPKVAYFCMEFGLANDIPTYSGGLGMLAGDILRAAADLGVAMVGVSLLYRKGYFAQSIDAGKQLEADVHWWPEQHLKCTDVEVKVEIEGRAVALRVWRYVVEGVDGHEVPVYLLDSDLEGNHPDDRKLSESLYLGDERYRLAQETVLGMGGQRALRALGFEADVFHMNEGHAALLALDLLGDALAGKGGKDASDAEFAAAVAAVRRRCVFTTHTPVPAGHDRFSRSLATQVLGQAWMDLYSRLPGLQTAELNMSVLGLELSHFVNGVAQRHGEVTRGMFPGREIHAITNGIHAVTWTAPSFAALFDRHIPHWRHHNYALRLAQSIPLDEISAAHMAAKRALIDEVNRHGHEFSPDLFTIGFARRATSYKRPLLLLRDARRLADIASRWGTLQIVFAGKSHPRDLEGKRLIESIHQMAPGLAPHVRIAFVPGYNMRLGLMMVSGVDLWLNTPMAPLEASGTSGMKAAHNGVPSLSVKDGWWCEGHIEGYTGWAIDPTHHHGEAANDADSAQLYRLLDEEILPLHLRDPKAWAEVMRNAIAINGSYFNAERMVGEYLTRAYLPR